MLRKLEILGKNVREFLEIYTGKPGNVREFFLSQCPENPDNVRTVRTVRTHVSAFRTLRQS